MSRRLVGCALIALAFIMGWMAWLPPLVAHSSPALAPATIRSVAPPPTGVDVGDCSVSPCRTIGYAITKSSYGDRINVASGTFTEHITMTNGVSVHGNGWPNTIINGNFSDNLPVVYFPPGIDSTTVLSGVQATHGGTGDPASSSNGSGIRIYQASPQIINTWAYSNTSSSGGGVNVAYSSPTLNNVPAWNNRASYGGGYNLEHSPLVTITSNQQGTNGTIFFNYASGNGGGIYTLQTTATISGLRIDSNVSDCCGGGVYIEQTPGMMKLLNNDISYNLAPQEGGIEVHSVPNIQIVGNTMISNTAGAYAGAIRLGYSAGLFNGNTLIGNRVTDAGMSGGGATVGASSTLKMEGNWFERNSSTLSGGGVYIYEGSVVDLNANTFVSNTSSFGGGVYLASMGALTVTNNIIARNTAALGGAGLYAQNTLPLIVGNNSIANNTGTGITFNAAGGIQLYNNIVYGNTGGGLVRLDGSSYFADYNDVASNSPDYSNVVANTHDVSLNPIFIGTGTMFNYYHIQPTSPVSKTGWLISPPLYDIDGEPRVLCNSMGADQICSKRLMLPIILK